MKKFFLPVSLLIFLIFAACSHKSTPTVAVTKVNYTTDVLPMIQSKCTPCHLPSKGGFKANFENYINAQLFGTAMVTRIELDPSARGFMPFKNSKLTVDEINVFKNWVRDGLMEK